MGAPFERRSDTEWTWQMAGRNYSVRVFAATRRLIWSSWAETSEGPVFDDGFAQATDRFLAGEVPRPAPPELVAALMEYLKD